MMGKKIHIRWMIRRDIPQVMAIEGSKGSPWTEEQFFTALKHSRCIGLVAELADESIGGFVIYMLQKRHIEVLNFAVRPDVRRQRIGAAMVDKLMGKLLPHRRNRVELISRETRTEFSVFLRSMGFKAEHVIRNHFDEPEEDGYAFVRRHASCPIASLASSVANPREN